MENVSKVKLAAAKRKETFKFCLLEKFKYWISVVKFLCKKFSSIFSFAVCKKKKTNIKYWLLYSLFPACAALFTGKK